METITVPRTQPGEGLTISTHITASKEQAIKEDNAGFTRGIRIYTDGSGYKNKIGTAAVLYNKGRRIVGNQG